MKYEELKQLRQEGVELGKKGLFQDAQIKLYKAFNSSHDFAEFHLEVGLDLVAVYRRMESYTAALELVDYVAGYDFEGEYFVTALYAMLFSIAWHDTNEFIAFFAGNL